MQISKLLPAICAAAICAGLVSVRAQDNPAQAAARAALLQKMGELDAADGNPPAIVVTPSGATVEKPAPPVIQTPPPTPTLPEPPVTPALSGDNPAQAAARAALLEKMSGLDAANAQTPAIVVTPSGATPEKPAPPAIQTPPPASTLPGPQTTASESEAQAKIEAQKKAQAAAQADAVAQAEARAKAQQAAKIQKAAAKANDLGFNPIEAPALPVSAAKQEQLQALLVKYRADQITPEEYQTQRAAILAQP